MVAPHQLCSSIEVRLSTRTGGRAPTLTNGTDSTDPQERGGGAVLFIPAQLGIDNRGTTAVTVAREPATPLTYRFEYHDPTTQTWSTLASTDPTAPDDQHVASVHARPNQGPGVTYPNGADTIAGTIVAPGALASWAATVRIDLTVEQTQLLLDPTRVDAIRSTVTLPTTGNQVRKITRFSLDPLTELRTAPAATLSDAHIHITRPGHTPETFDASTTPELSTLEPGQSAVTHPTSTVTEVPTRTTSETSDAYLARLHALDGTALFATAHATAVAGVGPVFAPQQLARSTVHVPVVEASLSAPTVVDAGNAITWTVTLTNTGSEAATTITAAMTVAGIGALPLAGLPEQVAPGERDCRASRGQWVVRRRLPSERS